MAAIEDDDIEDDIECDGCGEAFATLDELTCWKRKSYCCDCLEEVQDKEYEADQHFNEGVEVVLKEIRLFLDTCIQRSNREVIKRLIERIEKKRK